MKGHLPSHTGLQKHLNSGLRSPHRRGSCLRGLRWARLRAGAAHVEDRWEMVDKSLHDPSLDWHDFDEHRLAVKSVSHGEQ